MRPSYPLPTLFGLLDIQRTFFVSNNVRTRMVKSPASADSVEVLRAARLTEDRSSLEHDHVWLLRSLQISRGYFGMELRGRDGS
jgi:hypothetical protein